MIDYEAELAVVIGKKCRNVSKDEALNYVAGKGERYIFAFLTLSLHLTLPIHNRIHHL
jgi:hypothetical protein